MIKVPFLSGKKMSRQLSPFLRRCWGPNSSPGRGVSPLSAPVPNAWPRPCSRPCPSASPSYLPPRQRRRQRGTCPAQDPHRTVCFCFPGRSALPRPSGDSQRDYCLHIWGPRSGPRPPFWDWRWPRPWSRPSSTSAGSPRGRTGCSCARPGFGSPPRRRGAFSLFFYGGIFLGFPPPRPFCRRGLYRFGSSLSDGVFPWWLCRRS